MTLAVPILSNPLSRITSRLLLSDLIFNSDPVEKRCPAYYAVRVAAAWCIGALSPMFIAICGRGILLHLSESRVTRIEGLHGEDCLNRGFTRIKRLRSICLNRGLTRIEGLRGLNTRNGNTMPLDTEGRQVNSVGIAD